MIILIPDQTPILPSLVNSLSKGDATPLDFQDKIQYMKRNIDGLLREHPAQFLIEEFFDRIAA